MPSNVRDEIIFPPEQVQEESHPPEMLNSAYALLEKEVDNNQPREQPEVVYSD